MPKRPTVLLALIAIWPIAFAQDAAPTSRAQRDADNPLRLIIEAGKLKPRKAAEPEKPVRAPERVQVRARTVAEAPVAATAPGAGSEPTVAPPAPAAAPPAASAPTPAPVETPPATVAPAPPPVPVPQADPPVEAQIPGVAPRASLATEPVIDVPLAPLRVAQMVEPVLPRRIADRVRGEVEVVVGFTVQPDGSVSDLVVQSSTHPAVNATVLAAVAQWRYGPIPAPREHAVQVLLRGEN